MTLGFEQQLSAPSDDQYGYSDAFRLQPTDRLVHSATGSDYVCTADQYDEYEAAGVDIADFLRYKEITIAADELKRGLPDLPISDGVVTAMKAKAAAFLTVLKRVDAGESEDLTHHDVRRAMRDVYFLYSSLNLVLGAHDTQEAIEKNLTFAYPLKDRHLNKGRYESIIAVKTETLLDEGDFDSVVGEDRDYAFQEGMPYQGIVKITIDPSKRIEFSYTPEQESAWEHHASKTVINDKNNTVYDSHDLSLRIDLDSTAPEGIALDLGRSRFEGDKLSRPGDLLGKVFSLVSPDGSHEYAGFSSDMVPQFAQFADELALQQHLFHKWRDDERRGRVSSRLQEAVFARYVENNPNA